MGRTLDPNETQIAWFPEEREYRIVRQKIQTVTVVGAEIAVETAEVGGLVSWVNETPEDPEDGSGHFELWSGKPENYQPIRTGESEEG